MLEKNEQSDRDPNTNEKPESCYCSALPKGSGLCLPCYTRWLASKQRALASQHKGCRRNDLRRCSDGTVVEYIDQRSMKPLTIHRLVQKVI